MAKKPKRQNVNLDALLATLELKRGIEQHCLALRATISLLEADKKPAAIARLEGAVSALEAVVRGQCAGLTMPCPTCQQPQNVTAWVDAHKCDACGSELIWPPTDDDV